MKNEEAEVRPPKNEERDGVGKLKRSVPPLPVPLLRLPPEEREMGLIGAVWQTKRACARAGLIEI
jgi:hypothetical protein